MDAIFGEKRSGHEMTCAHARIGGRGLSTCANSGYQALFSDFSNRPGDEAE